jgi:hypothetical protein
VRQRSIHDTFGASPPKVVRARNSPRLEAMNSAATPNRSGLASTGGGPAGGASMLSGVEQARSNDHGGVA